MRPVSRAHSAPCQAWLGGDTQFRAPPPPPPGEGGRVLSPPPPALVPLRRVVAPLRGPGQSPVLPFACCVGSLLSVGRCGRFSCWCRFHVRGAPPPPPPPNLQLVFVPSAPLPILRSTKRSCGKPVDGHVRRQGGDVRNAAEMGDWHVATLPPPATPVVAHPHVRGGGGGVQWQ